MRWSQQPLAHSLSRSLTTLHHRVLPRCTPRLWLSLVVSYKARMGILSHLFKKKDEPAPYDWESLKQQCLLAIRSQGVPAQSRESSLGDLDFERLEVSGEDAEDVVVEIWALLRGAKTPSFSSAQTQE